MLCGSPLDPNEICSHQCFGQHDNHDLLGNPLWLGNPLSEKLCCHGKIIYKCENKWAGWWCNNNLEKYYIVSLGRIIYPIYEMENKIHVPNHQPDDNSSKGDAHRSNSQLPEAHENVFGVPSR